MGVGILLLEGLNIPLPNACGFIGSDSFPPPPIKSSSSTTATDERGDDPGEERRGGEVGGETEEDGIVGAGKDAAELGGVWGEERL